MVVVMFSGNTELVFVGMFKVILDEIERKENGVMEDRLVEPQASSIPA